jgi:hypothetical protein
VTRRSLTWLVAIPLLLAGSQVGHVLAYRLLYPDAHLRLRQLLATGHDYLEHAPLILGLAAAVVLLSLFLCVVAAARGEAPQPLQPWAFALLPALAFTFQEHLERLLHTGTLPVVAVLDPTFLPGLLLQLPIGVVAYLVARLLLRASEHVGRALVRLRLPRRGFGTALAKPARPAAPARRSPLAYRQAQRGPPAAAFS